MLPWLRPWQRSAGWWRCCRPEASGRTRGRLDMHFSARWRWRSPGASGSAWPLAWAGLRRHGLGFLITNAMGLGDMATIMAVALFLTAFALMANGVFSSLSRMAHR